MMQDLADPWYQTAPSCHTGRGRCLWLLYIPVFAGKTGNIEPFSVKL